MKAAMKAAALWLVLVIGQGVGGWLFFHATITIPNDGPLDAAQAMLTVSVADALVLTLLAEQMQPRGWKLGLTLAAVLFGVQTGLTMIETVIFNSDVRMPAGVLLGATAVSLFRATLAGAAVALLWRGRDAGLGLQLRGLAWKVAAIAVLYVPCYFLAGQLIAWPSPAVRVYYAHVNQNDPAVLAGLQFGRGLIWCGFAFLLARSLSGPAWRTALLTGLTFGLVMMPQGLYPNPFMPWPVRAMHMIETGVSNFIFGALAALILLAGARPATAGRPSADAPGRRALRT